MNSEWDYLRLIQTRFPGLGVQLLRFNFCPASYLHHHRRADLIPEIPDMIWEIERLHARLSDRILRKSEALERPAFSFPHWGWSVALLPPTRIARLSLHLGALVHGGRVRASLSRENVLKWKGKLGREAYDFSMTRASLLPPMKDVGPDLLSLEPDQCGLCLLSSASLDMPEAMRLRFVWKLPKTPGESSVDPLQASKLVRSVLSIVEPEWHSSTLPIAQ